MKRVILVLFVLSICMIGFSCRLKSEAEDKQITEINKLISEANQQARWSNIVNFQQKRLMKTIFEQRNKESLINYVYIKSSYHDKLIFIGKCIGYRIPLSKADSYPPLSPISSYAKWLMMIDPKTKSPHLAYIESEILVIPFKLNRADGCRITPGIFGLYSIIGEEIK